MKIHCSDIDNLLMEGDRFSMEVAETHAASCAVCSEKVAGFNDISLVARGMQTRGITTCVPRIEACAAQERPAHARVAAGRGVVRHLRCIAAASGKRTTA